LSYKPDVDDLRESPAIEICHKLAEEGARVLAYEPYKPEFRQNSFETATTLAAALDCADILPLLVSNTALRNLEPQVVAQLTPARLVVDCVNAWPVKEWEQHGFRVIRLGASLSSDVGMKE
ncbi:MAG: UDP-N-acetyl-D-mannosamine dehydrogenase, partial [Chloroflexi bacterium]